MDVAEIARRTALPVRAVRYVLDHQVLSGLNRRRRLDRAGRPRDFAALDVVAAAAALFFGGVRRQLITDIFTSLSAIPWRFAVGNPAGSDEAGGGGRSVLEILCLAEGGGGGATVLSVGDGAAIRINTDALQSCWFDPKTCGRFDVSYRPKAEVSVDFGLLRQLLGVE
jgi:hypothetical protein